MKDVAAMAGVSLSTVSRVVNGQPVDAALAAKVHRAVELLGYRHNYAAGALRRSGGSASIGLVCEDISDPFFAAFHRGVEQIARERSVATLAASTDGSPDRERDVLERMLGRRVEGLLLIPTGKDHSYLRRDVANGTGLVFVNRPPKTIDTDCVVTDHRGGARAAIEHLRAHGHRRIAYVGPGPEAGFAAAERLAGYREAMAGLDEDIVSRGDLQPLLAGEEPPTAVFSSQNLVTIEVMRTLFRLGLDRVVAHVGVDDIPLRGAIEPPVTIVAHEALMLGRAAAELLFSRVDGFDGRAREVVSAPTLIPRGTGELLPVS
ncbi:LacI family DNA-binding transcriptional regulator [Solirubrobacter sp. CPCC 204708]|uniref:LacI family transcriptional regulator n=1 Tax=Solirubrobacter deserti TaxID=2282478 RepID=A0ABT4RR03_9ACTN|nr:LacI family DNA-binding transcriptional regulator [Solirubrobacter deserti]MBE2320658.1 LacI family DNA-binding transcriptional regulator [Solirubrobacter deserti]MDA0140710.1 LacI family transcriptional regulator [Solirubrobacter deserti]